MSLRSVGLRSETDLRMMSKASHFQALNLSLSKSQAKDLIDMLESEFSALKVLRDLSLAVPLVSLWSHL